MSGGMHMPSLCAFLPNTRFNVPFLGLYCDVTPILYSLKRPDRAGVGNNVFHHLFC